MSTLVSRRGRDTEVFQIIPSISNVDNKYILAVDIDIHFSDLRNYERMNALILGCTPEILSPFTLHLI